MSGLVCDTRTHTLSASLFSLLSVHAHVGTHSFSPQPHLPFWSSWVCHPFYKQAFMTSQQVSSLSEDKEWLLAYIAYLQCTDSSKAPSGLWETLGFFLLLFIQGRHSELFFSTTLIHINTWELLDGTTCRCFWKQQQSLNGMPNFILKGVIFKI